jgi:hypothetical protein
MGDDTIEVTAGDTGYIGGYTNAVRLAQAPDGRFVLQRQEQRYDTGQTRWENMPTAKLTAEQFEAAERGSGDWE